MEKTNDKGIKKIILIVKDFLKTVSDIAEGKIKNTLNKNKLKGKNKYEILATFIKYNKTDILSAKRTSTQEKRKARSMIFKSCGVNILKRQRYEIKDNNFQTNHNTEEVLTEEEGSVMIR